jgi:hypothetical protein
VLDWIHFKTVSIDSLKLNIYIGIITYKEEEENKRLTKAKLFDVWKLY